MQTVERSAGRSTSDENQNAVCVMLALLPRSLVRKMNSQSNGPWRKNGSKRSAPTDGIASGGVCLLAAVQQPQNLILVSALARQANMLGGDPALAVDEKRSWEGFNAAVHLCDGAVTKHDRVVHRLPPKVGLHRPPTVVIHGHTQHGEARVLVRILELDEPGNLDFAGTAPGRPKIEQNNFSPVIGKLDSRSICIRHAEIRGCLTI